MKNAYEDMYCHCIEKYGAPPWCGHWSDKVYNPFCVLEGNLSSNFCPGAQRMIYNGTIMDDYLSTHSSVCNRTKGELIKPVSLIF